MPAVELRHGQFSWVDLVTDDVEAGLPFYEGLFGWSHSVGPSPGGAYYMFEKGGRPVAGMVAMPPGAREAGFPPIWMSYILVEDMDAALARTRELGGAVPMEPRVVSEAGRMAMIQDPGGASVGLWEADEFTGAALFNEPGTLVWNELVSREAPAARAFYQDLLGWGWQDMPMPDGSIYKVILLGDRPNGGVMAMTDDWPEGTPSYWAVYFQIEDLERSHARALELGAMEQVAPEDTPVGRISVVADPAGAVFSLFEPVPSQD